RRIVRQAFRQAAPACRPSGASARLLVGAVPDRPRPESVYTPGESTNKEQRKEEGVSPENSPEDSRGGEARNMTAGVPAQPALALGGLHQRARTVDYAGAGASGTAKPKASNRRTYWRCSWWVRRWSK